ncbi:MAG: FecR domain-containing protein [Anaerolineales bacterium]|nr:FecR domain-containing protein [Anaerolineales bacterium]
MLTARRWLPLLLAALVLAACSSAPATPTSASATSTSAPAANTAVGTATLPSEIEAAVVRSAQLSELKNEVQAMRQAGESFTAAREGDVVVLGGRVSTGAESKVRLDLTEGTIVRLGAETEFTVEALTQTANDPFTRLKLLTGQLWVILNGGSLEVETPVGVATVRGSYLGVMFDPVTRRLSVTCLEGQCGLSNDQGTVQLTNGQSSEIVGEDAPTPIEALTYEEIQAWLEENPEAETIVEEVYPEGTPTPDPNATNDNGNEGGGSSGGGGGGNFQYTIGNQCQENVTVTYSGPESGTFTVAPGETKSGELPPGEYTLTNSRDGGGGLTWNSANGPLTGSFCDDGGSAGGGGTGQPPGPNTEPLRYALMHNCPADPQTGVVREGTWEWTFENLTTGQTYNVSVQPGESQSGEFPPGRYRVSDRDATGPLTNGEIDSGGPGINVSRCGGG